MILTLSISRWTYWMTKEQVQSQSRELQSMERRTRIIITTDMALQWLLLLP